MYPVSASNSTRPDERRRNSRLRVPSIIYAQLGSTCGGIVVNLSLDGVSCLTAIRLPVGNKTSFDMKLRGAGLNVELTGEVVWLGATQKKAGIRFKDVSPEARKEISEWIVRESQLFGPVGMDNVTSVDERPGFSAASQSHAARALTIAPDGPRDESQTSDAGDEDENVEGDFAPPSAALLKPARVKPGSVPVEPTRAAGPAAPFQPRNTSLEISGASVAAPSAASRSRSDALFEPISAAKPDQFPAPSTLPPAAAEKTSTPAREGQVGASPEPSANRDSGKAEDNKANASPSAAIGSAAVAFSKPSAPAPVAKPQPVSAAPVGKNESAKPKAPETARLAASAASASSAAISGTTKKSPAAEQGPQTSGKPAPAKIENPKNEKNSGAITAQTAKAVVGSQPSQAAARWIPPAILDLWRTGDRTQKIVVAGLGIGCVTSFLLMIVLSAVHVVSSPNSAGRSVLSAPVAREVATANSEVAVDTTEPASADPDQSPPASPFMYLVNLVFGAKDDSELPFLRHPVAIDPSHVAVQVWTSKASGYYYCMDNQMYKAMQPGRFMSQRDALQAGYQPKLGKFCN